MHGRHSYGIIWIAENIEKTIREITAMRRRNAPHFAHFVAFVYIP